MSAWTVPTPGCLGGCAYEDALACLERGVTSIAGLPFSTPPCTCIVWCHILYSAAFYTAVCLGDLAKWPLRALWAVLVGVGEWRWVG